MTDEGPPQPPAPPMAPPGAPPPPGMPPAPPGPPPGAPPAPPDGAPPAPPGPPPGAPPAPPGPPPGAPPAPPDGAPPAPPGAPPAPPDGAPPPAPPDGPPPGVAPDAPPATDPLGVPSLDPLAPPPPAMSDDAPADPLGLPPASVEDPLGAPSPPMVDPLGAPPAPPSDDPLGMSSDAALMPPAPPIEPAPHMPPDEPTGTIEESFEVTAGDSDQIIEHEASTDSEIIHAGATLRRIEDVDAVEGDKFMADVREVDQSTFSPSGERLSQDFAGEITLKNPSQRDRLWDIDLFIDQVSMTSLESDDEGSHHMALQELKAGDDHSTSYTATCPSVLTIAEVLDTHPGAAEEPVQVMDARSESTACTLTLTISNQHTLSANEILVQRTIPQEFTMDSPSEEGAKIKEQRLTWNIESLSPGESTTLALTGSVATNFVEPVPTGQVTMEYKVSTPISGMSVSELDAFCRGFGVMNIDQADTPNEWNCQVRFQNKSTFAIDLTSLRVSNQEDESILFEIDDISEDVLPDGTWLSETKPVNSVQQPRFNQDLNYTALPRLATGSSGHASMEQADITVLDGKLSKAFEQPVLRSFVQEENSATLTFRNIGSAIIKRIEIFDDVPGLFQSPNTAAARVTIAGDELPSDRWDVQVSEGQQIEQEALTIGHPGCHLHFSIGTSTPIELLPGQSMLVTYPLISADPDKANPMIPAPSRIEFGGSVHGPTCGRANFDTPMLEVRHERRKFTTGKEIFPAGPPGNYEVFLMYQNRSENALRELVVSDLCPPGFEVTSERLTSSLHGDLEVTSTLSTSADGTLLEWKIERMDPEEQVDVIYEIQGDPDVEFKASEVQTVVGGDAGEFVETIGEEEEAEAEVEADASPSESTDDDGESSAPAPEPDDDAPDSQTEVASSDLETNDEVKAEDDSGEVDTGATPPSAVDDAFEEALGSLASITHSADRKVEL